MDQLEEAQQIQNSVQDDFDRERNDMYDTICELTNQLKLKNMIIESFIQPEEFKKIEKVTEWNEEENDWIIVHPAAKQMHKKNDSKRPQSAVGMKRPTSEYSRIAKGLGDLNPRYKFDNILQLDLDMPERTTEDYEGRPSEKVKQAITAILNDDSRDDVELITQLINFNDKILDDYDNESKQASSAKGSTKTSSQSSMRPKSSKRPKSAKKKPV